MDDLNDFVKKNSKFLKIESGEIFEGTFLSYAVGPSKFDPEKMTVTYTLSAEGRKLFWQTASNNVARTFAKLKPGALIRISAKGQGTQKQYQVTSPDLLPPSQPSGGIDISPDELKPDDEVPF